MQICRVIAELPESKSGGPGVGAIIGERLDRDRAEVLAVAACVALALLLAVPIPETSWAERLKCRR